MTLLWLSQHTAYIPAVAGTRSQYGIINTRFALPFSYCQALAVMFDDYRVASIVRLFLRRGPATITGRVRAIIVDALYRVSHRRPRPHVGDKISKVHPSVANPYSPASVAWIVLVLLIQASFFDSAPRIPFGSVFTAVSGDSRTAMLPAGMATGFGNVKSQLVTQHIAFNPTIAAAQPEATAWDGGYYYPLTISCADFHSDEHVDIVAFEGHV